MIETWNVKCPICGLDLPLNAPAHQKYCSIECRLTAEEEARLKRYPAHNARRRQARIDEKRDRPPCPECGTPIPPEAPASRKFCTSICMNRSNNRDRREREKTVRAAMREKANAGLAN